ncbi:MAG: peptidase M48 [Thermodesulfovibrio sp.]|nr:peptidase M48 [Thermodesulfovibrio sp.]
MDNLHQYQFVILAAYLVVQGADFWLEMLNLRHMKRCGATIPEGFENHIDSATLKKAAAYTLDKMRFGIIESIVSSTLLIIFLFGGLLGRYDAWVDSLQLSFIAAGIVFFLGLHYINTILSLPFSVYSTFRLENRYGFNTMSGKLWFSDLLKSALLSTLLLGTVLAAGLWIVQASAEYWWLYAWGFFLVFSLFLMYLSPYVIEPLFNKFTPLEGEGLTERIRETMGKAGIQISSVLKIDSSKRSRHTNAYFTGIGKVKRIVMYDTLLAKMDDSEIVAILAHEIGHWKKRHILKRIVTVEVMALAGMYIAFRLLQSDLPAALFGLKGATFYAKTVILSFIAGIVTFPFAALSNYISRRHEEEADRFAAELTGDPESLATSLIKLSRDNLSNLHPHPWYAAFNYSHPPVIERIRTLRSLAGSKPDKQGGGD